MDSGTLLQLIAEGESQTLEFKQSLSSGAQQEAMQSLVAFANTDGGRVLFGVRDDGTVSGVQIGTNTLENLANKVPKHTYPSLPVAIEHAEDDKGRKVLMVEAARDRPPVVGVYMYSGKPIQPDEEVEADVLQAYRRVGRTNQKEDFMRLRQPLPSDPRLRITIRSLGAPREGVMIRGMVWMEDGSGSAHHIRFEAHEDEFRSTTVLEDLPFPSELHTEIPGAKGYPYKTERVVVSQAWFEFSGVSPALSSSIASDFRLRAVYRDDWGITWESSRNMKVWWGDNPKLLDVRGFSRRIRKLPAKEFAILT